MSPLTRFETREPGEDWHAAHIIAVMRRMQERLYRPGATLRDAHTRHTALLEAEFTVAADLPPELAIGLFARPARYDAWVRFSNAHDQKQSDSIPDLRGCAIKLRDVPGERIPESDEPTSQDFVLMQTPTIPLGTVKLFHDAIHLVTEWSPLAFAAKMLLTGQARVLKQVDAVKVNPASPADIRYWSTTPYLLGPDRVVKYSLTPTSEYRSTMPERPGDTYLTDALAAHLAEAEASFDFQVQLRTDPAAMPVEDIAIRWSEDESDGGSPFRTVATLRIPRQDFRTPERDALSEALAFSPGHALAEHRPIGALNRVRMRVYAEQAAWRQQRDGRERVT